MSVAKEKSLPTKLTERRQLSKLIVDVKGVFLELCSPNNTDEVNDLIYDFVLLRYKRMRGRWFVKRMLANKGRKLKEVEY